MIQADAAIANSVAAEAGIKAGDLVLSIDGNETHVMNEAFPKLVNKLLNGEKVNIETTSGKYVLDYSKADLKKMNPNDIGSLMGFYFTGALKNTIWYFVSLVIFQILLLIPSLIYIISS